MDKAQKRQAIHYLNFIKTLYELSSDYAQEKIAELVENGTQDDIDVLEDIISQLEGEL